MKIERKRVILEWSFFSKFYASSHWEERGIFVFVFNRTSYAAATHHYSNIFQRSSNVYTRNRNFPLFLPVRFSFIRIQDRNGVFESCFKIFRISRLIYADDLMENSCSIIYWLPSRCDLRNGHIDLPDKMIKRRQKFITKAATDTDLSWNCGYCDKSNYFFVFFLDFTINEKLKNAIEWSLNERLFINFDFCRFHTRKLKIYTLRWERFSQMNDRHAQIANSLVKIIIKLVDKSFHFPHRNFSPQTLLTISTRLIKTLYSELTTDPTPHATN